MNLLAYQDNTGTRLGVICRRCLASRSQPGHLGKYIHDTKVNSAPALQTSIDNSILLTYSHRCVCWVTTKAPNKFPTGELVLGVAERSCAV